MRPTASPPRTSAPRFVKSSNKTSSRLFLLTLAGLLLPASVGLSQSDSPEDSPDMVVEATAPTPTTSTPHSADVVVPHQLSGTGQSLADAIEQLPGVHLRRSGGVGSFTSIGIRGLGMNYVNVVLNDSPFDPGGAGGVDLSLLPLEHIERVEVYRGGGPLRFQSPLGGVVRIITRIPSERTTAEGHLGYGSYHSRSAHLGVSGRLFDTGLVYHSMVSYLGSEGDFDFRNDNNTLYNTSDDFEDTRNNNASNAGALSLTLQGPAPARGLWDLSLRGNWRKGQLPGPHPQRGVLPPDASAEDQGARLNLELRDLQSPGSTLTGSAQFYLGASARDFTSEGALLGLDVRSIHSTHHQGGLRAQLEYLVGPAFLLRIAGGGDWERRTQRSPTTAVGGLGGTFSHQRWRPSLGAELQVMAPAGVEFFPSLRVDGEDLHALALTPKLGALLTLGALQVRANAGRHHRFPSATERFGDGLQVAPSPGLEPEHGLVTDASLQLQEGPGGVTLNLGAFHTQIQGLIALLPTSQRYVRAHNLTKQHLTGVELGLQKKWKRVDAAINYTGIEGRGVRRAQTPGVPTHRLDLQLTLSLGPLQLSYHPQYQSPIFLDPDNRLALPQRLLHDLDLTFFIKSSGLHLRLRGANLSNTQSARVSLPGGITGVATHGDYLGYPLPGRSVFASVGWKL